MEIKSIIFAAISLVSLTTANANADVFNVKDYGAVGDGITNDTNAFNDAVAVASLAGGGTVYVPCGEYLIGKNLGYAAGFYSGIQIISSNISLTGEGRCSELQPVNSSGNAIVTICSSATDNNCRTPPELSEIKISNLAFRDPTPFSHVGSEESHGIVAKNAINLVIENNYFIGLGDEAVDVHSGHDITIRGNHFNACPSIPGSGGSAISVSGSRHVSIDGNSITNAPSSSYNRGIDISTNNPGKSTSWINITNNRFLDNNYARDILLASSQAPIEHVVISSNQIESKSIAINYSGDGFKRSNIRIIDNEISGSIFMTADNLVIADNSVFGNTGHGLRIAGHNVKILDNIIKDFPKSCIFIITPEVTGRLEFSGNSCIETSSENYSVISFFNPSAFIGDIIIKNNILDAADGAKNGIARVGPKSGISDVNTAIIENTISGVLRGISGGGLISNNIITDVAEYGILITQDGAQVNNNRINGAGSRCIFINSADNAIISGNFMEGCGIFAIKIKNGSNHSICMGNNARNNLASVNIVCDVMIGNIQPGN